MENKIEVKARSKVIVFLTILVLLFASLFVTTSVYILRWKKDAKNNNNTSTAVTFSSLSGVYTGELNKATFDNEKQVKLYVYEDGSFRYKTEPGLDSCVVGYYTFTDGEIVLNELVGCANDPGRTIISSKRTLKKNDDGSYTDSKLNVTLKKSDEKIDAQKDIISTELINAFKGGFLSVGE